MTVSTPPGILISPNISSAARHAAMAQSPAIGCAFIHKLNRRTDEA